MTSRYYVVEIVVPPGGLGRRLDDMHEFHRQRGIKDQRGPRRRDDEHDYLRWCFADLATAEVFAAEFGGEVLQQRSRPPLLRAAVRANGLGDCKAAVICRFNARGRG